MPYDKFWDAVLAANRKKERVWSLNSPVSFEKYPSFDFLDEGAYYGALAKNEEALSIHYALANLIVPELNVSKLIVRVGVIRKSHPFSYNGVPYDLLRWMKQTCESLRVKRSEQDRAGVTPNIELLGVGKFHWQRGEGSRPPVITLEDIDPSYLDHTFEFDVSDGFAFYRSHHFKRKEIENIRTTKHNKVAEIIREWFPDHEVKL